MFQCRRSIAKNYLHIKNVEAQLAQLQSQLNLTTGPKKSALEMLRKKIEAKNEQVVAARQKFVSAQKVNAAGQALVCSTKKHYTHIKRLLCAHPNTRAIYKSQSREAGMPIC